MSARAQGREDGSTNVLVHTPAIAADGDANVLEFLMATPPDKTNILIISYVRSPDEWTQSWLDHAGEHPANLGIIQVGETTRSMASTQASSATAPTPDVLATVGNPSNLTELGITISEYLTDWDENPHETAVCFDSLTALLQYTDSVQTAFRFLHTLVGRVQTANARACYKITPGAHDRQTVATLRGLFDTVIEYEE
ncbi:DUF7504 family protein [Halomicrococcus sp. SG-WS-1]|uniref:DUF7504 family protein n=1 Tax=Halomicrococcus sp. SG-WS-1 TaxID=3439057 RepID=UPI003F79A433